MLMSLCAPVALFMLLLATAPCLQAQQDTTSIREKSEAAAKKARNKAIYGDARKASIMSACLPGLGQVHNKKYWKVPILYAALGGVVYLGLNSQRQYKYYSDNLRKGVIDPTANTTGYSTDQLIVLKNSEKKYRDYAIMGCALLYLLNIIDANVDAHLKTFDVSNDLSLRVRPYSGMGYGNQVNTGLTFQLTFK